MDNFMLKKLQKDFLDCIDIDKAIVVGSIPKAEGTLILFDLIDYVVADIASMDEASWNYLKEAEKEIVKRNEERKVKLFGNRKPKDSSQAREFEVDLLREDYRACKEILYFVQNLCYEKGWFR